MKPKLEKNSTRASSEACVIVKNTHSRLTNQESPKRVTVKKEETSDDEDSSETENPAAKKAKATVGKDAKTKKADSDNEEENDDESDVEMKTNNKRKAPEVAKGSNTRVFLMS